MSLDESAEPLAGDAATVVTVENFESIDLNAALDGVTTVEGYTFFSPLFKAADDADARGEQGAAYAYRLLATLAAFCFRVQDPATIFAPMVRGLVGRTTTASDISSEQNQVLAVVAPSLSHPALRARVADVVWYNERKRRDMAEIAVDAYCEVVEKRLSGVYRHSYLDEDWVDEHLIDFIERALQILAGTNKRSSIPARVKACVLELYNRAKDQPQFTPFIRIARLAQRYDLAIWETIAEDTELLASSLDDGAYPMAVKGLWDLAAYAQGKLNNLEAQRRCKDASVDQTLRMRDQVHSPMAKASWTMDVIGELRAIGGHRDRIKALRLELAELQDQALDELAVFTFPMDFTKERKGTVELFEGLTLPDIFYQFAAWWRPVPIADLRATALRNRDEFLFNSMSNSYIDRKGRVAASSPSDGHASEEPDEGWFKAQWLRELDLRRHIAVASTIDPALRTTTQRFPIEERHFPPIVAASPFVPQGHAEVFALGFARLFQGDYCSAAFLLIPQLENSIRYVMTNAGKESSKIKPDLLEEDRSLSGLLQNMRPEMDAVFGADLVNEIELLFHHKAGPNLRHQLAHGKLTMGDCYHHSAIYGCWLVYWLTCKPLLRTWKQDIAPLIEAAAH